MPGNSKTDLSKTNKKTLEAEKLLLPALVVPWTRALIDIW